MIYSDEHRQHGYAREAIAAIEKYCSEVLSLKQIWATVAADNEPSKRLFEACGYERSGVRKAWIRRGAEYIDEWEYQHLLR